ncbi:MAG: hypothetical protein NC453_10180 [Muribaculum sp.]|nr:hypothetical protein [Muribaculum sp.]
MNTENTLITKHRIIVVEFLNDKDEPTGENLYNDVLRYKTSRTIPIQAEYYKATSKEYFIHILKEIADSHSHGEIITLDIESHGGSDGIGAKGEFISWPELFDLTRPINVACGGLLVVMLSMCFGLTHLLAMEPEGRAPFLAIVASNREMYPSELYESFSAFFDLYDNPITFSTSMQQLHNYFEHKSENSPFISFTSLQWFDEFFKESRINLTAVANAPLLAESEGIDVDCAKMQIIEDMKEIKELNRSYFNFFDIQNVENVPPQYIYPETGGELN